MFPQHERCVGVATGVVDGRRCLHQRTQACVIQAQFSSIRSTKESETCQSLLLCVAVCILPNIKMRCRCGSAQGPFPGINVPRRHPNAVSTSATAVAAPSLPPCYLCRAATVPLLPPLSLGSCAGSCGTPWCCSQPPSPPPPPCGCGALSVPGSTLFVALLYRASLWTLF